MSHNFKAGDLALIINDNRFSENIGRCVELRFLVAQDEIYISQETGSFIKNTSGSPVWIVEGKGLRSDVFKNGWCQKAPHNLIPLKGDFEPVQQKDREVVA